MKRRTFIRQTGLATGMLFVPAFLKAFDLGKLAQNTTNTKRLVVIQLGGGNDWLNTIVPYQNDIYYQQRPKLAIPSASVIRINDTMGFNPALAALKEVFDQGNMAILNGVGYPHPDRSHFRSMDIWQSASRSNEYLNSGWLGRYLDTSVNEGSLPYKGIEVDDTLSLALKGNVHKGMAIKNLGQLYTTTRSPFFKNISNKGNHSHDAIVSYLYQTLADTYASTGYLYEKCKTYSNDFNYPDSGFAKQLKQISTFIQSGIGTQVYYVSLNGFDTHVGQRGKQDHLLQVYAEGLRAFIQDLSHHDQWKDTLVMTFSEFGRRVAQNGSGGTDHGTAGNVFIHAGSLSRKGILNEAPNLNALDEGDLKYTLDFRNIYATLLKKWLGTPPAMVLEGFTEILDFIG